MLALLQTTRSSGRIPDGVWAKLIVALDPEELADGCTHAIAALRELLLSADPKTVRDAAMMLLRLECARMRHGFGSSFPADDDDVDEIEDCDIIGDDCEEDVEEEYDDDDEDEYEIEDECD